MCDYRVIEVEDSEATVTDEERYYDDGDIICGTGIATDIIDDIKTAPKVIVKRKPKVKEIDYDNVKMVIAKLKKRHLVDVLKVHVHNGPDAVDDTEWSGQTVADIRKMCLALDFSSSSNSRLQEIFAIALRDQLQVNVKGTTKKRSKKALDITNIHHVIAKLNGANLVTELFKHGGTMMGVSDLRKENVGVLRQYCHHICAAGDKEFEKALKGTCSVQLIENQNRMIQRQQTRLDTIQKLKEVAKARRDLFHLTQHICKPHTTVTVDLCGQNMHNGTCTLTFKARIRCKVVAMAMSMEPEEEKKKKSKSTVPQYNYTLTLKTISGTDTIMWGDRPPVPDELVRDAALIFSAVESLFAVDDHQFTLSMFAGEWTSRELKMNGMEVHAAITQSTIQEIKNFGLFAMAEDPSNKASLSHSRFFYAPGFDKPLLDIVRSFCY